MKYANNAYRRRCYEVVDRMVVDKHDAVAVAHFVSLRTGVWMVDEETYTAIDRI